LRLLALWLGLLSLIIHAPTHAAGKELVVGVQPYEPTRILIAEHEKLAAHLRQSLNRPVRLVTAKDVNAFGRHILAGDYELVIGAAHLVRLAQQDKGWQPLARYLPDTLVLLLARKEAENDTVVTLRGRTLATPERSRLVSLLAERWLADQGLLAERDFRVLETGSPGSTVHALVSGKADMAVATLASMSQIRSGEVEQLRVVQEITSAPRLVFAAHPGVKPDMRTRLQNALLAYPSPQGRQIVAMTEHELAVMDPYLDQTRRLLKHHTPSARQVAQ
jgi:ABC-type phosphate/phosphonate transport system substrate-binding protein